MKYKIGDKVAYFFDEFLMGWGEVLRIHRGMWCYYVSIMDDVNHLHINIRAKESSLKSALELMSNLID